MVAGDDETSEKAKLEVFDGSQPEKYRIWKRRAQLMLASLPSTMSESKHGPKLMSHISGEAESLLEQIPIEKICCETGAESIWQVLDEKYGPQQIDLLQDAMKTFFHELQVKNGEPFRQFLVRFEASKRKLEELEVKLPAVVLGFMFLKKLRLESQSESMLLTATSGDLGYDKLVKAMKAVFPEGKGSSVTKNSKDVFAADADADSEESDEMQCALDVMVADMQSRDDYDEEELLEAFESYTDVRRRMQEQKKNRGYYPRNFEKGKTEGYKITGAIRGRIDAIKARTRCHHCKQTGHWKRECPARGSGSASSGQGGKVSDKKEVLFVEADEKTKQLWEAFYVTTESEEKDVTWGSELPNDCRNAGNADTHSTGNRQRDDQSLVVQKEDVRRPERPFCQDGFHEAHLSEQFLNDSCLATCGVPDTACRKTLVGHETLARIETELFKHGLKVKRATVSNEFKFGNAGTLQSTEVAMIPGHVAGKRIVVKAAVLPGSGQETPLLLSKEFLRQLGTVLDLDHDEAVFPKLGVRVKLLETLRGHYALPLFDFAAAECHVAETSTKGKPVYDIDNLERLASVGSRSSQVQERVSAEELNHGIQLTNDTSGQQEFGQSPCVTGDPRDHEHVGADSRHAPRLQEVGSGTRLSSGFPQQSHRPQSQGDSREVPECGYDHGESVPRGQVLHTVDSAAHQEGQWCRHETSPGVHRLCGSVQAGAHEWRPGSDADSPSHAKTHGPRTSARSSSHGRDQHGLGGDSSGKPCAEVEGHDPGNDADGGEQGPSSPSANGHASQCRDVSEAHDAVDQKVTSRKVRRILKRNLSYINACDHVMENLNGDEGDVGSDVFHVVLRSVDVSEVFSVPRLCPVAEEKGLVGGKSFDILNGWNFLSADCRKQCLDDIRRTKPKHVHVSLPCGPFSVMQRLSQGKGDAGERVRKRVEAEVLLRFGVQVCELQMSEGRDFSFEHPKGADSWGQPCLKKLSDHETVFDVVFDQCQFGLKDPISAKPYQKGTRVITTNKYMKEYLDKRCTHDHEHERLEGQVKLGDKWVNRTRCAQVYPRNLVLTMIRAIRVKRNEDHLKQVQNHGLKEPNPNEVQCC